MMTSAEYKQLTAFAGIDGALLSVLWIMSFALTLGGLTVAFLGLAGNALMFVSPVFAFLRVRKFRDYARMGYISFGRAMMYSVVMFLYTSLIFALAQYIYFAYMDNGYMTGALMKILDSEEMQAAANPYGMTTDQMKEMFGQMSQIPPIEMALNFMSINVTIGIVFSLPIALLVRRRPK